MTFYTPQPAQQCRQAEPGGNALAFAVHLKGDERIRGDSDFVQSVLETEDEEMERRHRLKAQAMIRERYGLYSKDFTKNSF